MKSKQILSTIFHKYLPFLALLLAHAIWGANFVVAKVTLQEFPPNTLAFFRFAIASLLLTPFFLAESKKIKIKLEHLPYLVGAGVTIITLNIAFFFAGIAKTTAINAATLTLIIPILSVILGWIFLKETIYFINIGGVILGLIGALIILGVPQILTGSFSSEAFLGNLLIIAASIAFVVGAILSKKMLKIYPSLIVTGIAFFVGFFTFSIPALNEYLHDPLWVNNVSMLGVFGLIYMALLSSVSAYFLYEWGLAKTSVSTADLFQYIEPLIATALAILILGEDLNTIYIFGAILIIIGLFLGTRSKEKHHKIHKYHRH